MPDIGSPAPISSMTAFQMASQAGFSDAIVPGTTYSQKQVIVAIAGAESGLDAHNWNPNDPNGGSFGILQINGYWFSPQSGPAISRAGALDPQTSFNYAYRVISARGTNFLPWTTFKNNAYKSHIQQNSPAQLAVNNLPTNGWWNFNITHGYGSFPDAQGYYFQPDNNIFGVPAGYPIAAILPGVVTGTHGSDVSYGAVVTVKMDTPINNLATHYVMLHMTRVTVSIGQRVNAGEILGYAGGNITAGSAPASLGFALYPGDDYATDGNFQKYFGAGNKSAPPQLDSYEVAIQAANGTLNIQPLTTLTNGGLFAGGIGNFAQNFSSSTLAEGVLKTATVPFKPDEGVAIVLEALDFVMQIKNPIPDGSVIFKDVSDPLTAISIFFTVWIPAFLNELVIDMAAFTLRAMIVGLGIYILFKVVNNFIDISGAIQTGFSVASKAALAAGGV